MKQLIPLALTCSILFIGCGERSVGTSRVPAEEAVTPYVVPSKGAAGLPLGNPAQVATNTAAAVGKLNPAHGQPGHRCDIAVGAALPVDNAAAAPVGSAPLANPAQSTITAPAATGKLNPAHGQPGHRCDIAVGAALPASNVAAAPAVISPAINTLPVPAPASTAGLNPAHGKPGHRCDIPVGSPLNSKPAGK